MPKPQGPDPTATTRLLCQCCRFVWPPGSAASREPCPNCGGLTRTIDVEMTDHIQIRDEFECCSLRGDAVEAERISKTDGNTDATLSANAGHPVQISLVRRERQRNMEAEGEAAASLANAYNKRSATDYAVQTKSEEDSDYPDRVLVSASGSHPQIIVQIRNLDDQMIATVGKTRKFDGSRNEAALRSAIATAIDAKAQVDARLKAQTLLLLMLPSPLGQLTRDMLLLAPFDICGFRGVWIAPFRESAFELHAGPL